MVAVGLPRVFLLQVRRVDQHEMREIVRAGRAEHPALEPLRHEPRKVADVIEVRVREDDGVDRARRNRQILPVPAAQLVAALKQATVHKDAMRAGIDEMLRAGHRARRAEERQRRHVSQL